MYKYHKKNELNVMEYDFDSMRDLLGFVESAPLSNVWKNAKTYSEDTENPGFYGTENLKEAMDLCKYGQHDSGYNKLLSLKENLDRYIKETERLPRQYNEFFGFAPDVASYLMGHPLDMFNHKKRVRKKVDVYFNLVNKAFTDKNQIFNRGAILFSLISKLEEMNADVNLFFFAMSECNDQVHFSKVIVKNEAQRLNTRNAYFPIVNPSMQRRIIFRLREKTPDITMPWTDGYGNPCGIDTIKKIIKVDDQTMIFGTCDEMGIKGDDIVEDAQNAFSFIEGTSDVLKKSKFEGMIRRVGHEKQQ